MRGKRLWGSALVAAAIALSASAEIYRWTDANGVVHYSSDFQQVPAGQRDLARAAVRTGKGSLQRIESSAASRPRVAHSAAPPAALASGEVVEGMTEVQWRDEATRLRTRIALYAPAAERCEGDRFRGSPGDGGDESREEQAEAEACRQTLREFELAKKQVADFEERAQRASVPPGWIRE